MNSYNTTKKTTFDNNAYPSAYMNKKYQSNFSYEML